MTNLTELLARWDSGDGKPYKGSLIDMAAYEADPSNIGCMCAQGQALHLLGGWSPERLRDAKQVEADRETAKLLNISVAHSVLLRLVNDKADGAPSIVLTHPEKVLGDQAHIVLAFWRHLDRMTDEQWAAARAAAWAAARDAAWAAAADAAAAAGAAAWAAARDAAWASAAAAAAASVAAARDAAWASAADAAAAAGAAAWAAARDAAWASAAAAAAASVAAARDAAWASAADAAAAAGDAARDAAWAAAGDAAADAACGAAAAAQYACAEIQGAKLMRERGKAFYFLPMFGFADPEAVLAADLLA